VDAETLITVRPHLRALSAAVPAPLAIRAGMVLSTALILASRGDLDARWPVVAVGVAWVLGTTLVAMRGDHTLESMGGYVGARTAIADTIVAVIAIAATDGADSSLRWVLLAAPAMWAWAEHRRVAVLMGLGAVGYLVAATPDLLGGESDTPKVVAEFLLTYAGAAAIALATAHARRRDTEAMLAVATTRAELFDEMARHERRQQEDIAVRLHDGPLQMVISVRQDLDELIDGEDPDLEAMREALTCTITGLRDLNRDLYEDVLRDDGLAAALERAAEATRRNGGPPIEVHVEHDAAGPHDRFVLSVVNELLTNVRKHARATAASVAVDRPPSGELRVTVADDGVGLTPEAARGAADRGHLGLRSIERRIAAAGGRLVLEPVLRGTSVRICLPAGPGSPDCDPSPELSRRVV
jgi:two-component system NarL family sensor kinase